MATPKFDVKQLRGPKLALPKTTTGARDTMPEPRLTTEKTHTFPKVFPPKEFVPFAPPTPADVAAQKRFAQMNPTPTLTTEKTHNFVLPKAAPPKTTFPKAAPPKTTFPKAAPPKPKAAAPKGRALGVVKKRLGLKSAAPLARLNKTLALLKTLPKITGMFTKARRK